MRRIVVIGPESTGKTTLAEHLSKHFSTVLVTEFARDFLTYLDRPYEVDDMLTIAKGQHDQEQSARIKVRLKANAKFSSRFKTKATPNDLVICDTDLRVIRIWSQRKFGQCDPWIDKQIAENKADLYLLCKPDIPWVADDLRENPNDLEELYQAYKNDLEHDGQKFVEISGDGKARIDVAVRAISRVF